MPDHTLLTNACASLERLVGHDPEALSYPPDMDLSGMILSSEECDRPDSCDCCGGDQ